TNQSLHAVLTALFRDTDFRFAIDLYNRVFITQHTPVITWLPSNAPDSLAGTTVTYVAPDENESNLLISSEEGKVHIIGTKSYRRTAGNATTTGYVRNIQNGEPLIGAAVFIDQPSIGAVADAMGYYSITLPKGKHTLRIRSF